MFFNSYESSYVFFTSTRNINNNFSKEIFSEISNPIFLNS